MSIFETIGMAWVIFTAALAHVAIVVLAYQRVQQIRLQAKRGATEEQRDVVEAFKVREAIAR